MGEVHLFVLWSEARHAESEILDDIARHFRMLDLAEVAWSPEAFAQNLRCLYGTALPADSPKERHSGTGPFLAVVVEDEHPRRRIRRLGRHWRWRRVNAHVFDARRRYRAMTGGGYRVHASENEREADRDLVLLFGRRAGEFRAGAAPEGTRRHAADIIGSYGWLDVHQLLLALDVTSGQRVLDPPDGVDLAIEVRDLWWASHVLGSGDGTTTCHDVLVDGRPTRVLLVERG